MLGFRITTLLLHIYFTFGFTPRISKRLAQPRVVLSAVDGWIDSLGIQLSGVSIKSFDGLRGIVANDDLDGKTAVVTVNSDAVLETINNRPPTPFPEFCSQQLWEESMWDNRLAFMLMHEKFVKGSSSSKNAWISELPSSFSTPLHWQDSDLAQLQYPELSSKVAKQREEWLRFYNKWQTNVPTKQVKSIKYDDFVWAMECINSRAFSGVYEGSSFAERRALILFTVFLAAVWPVAGFGSLEQSSSVAVAVAFSILARDFISSK